MQTEFRRGQGQGGLGDLRRLVGLARDEIRQTNRFDLVLVDEGVQGEGWIGLCHIT